MTVHLFAAARDLAGTATVVLDLPQGATVAELRQELLHQLPALATLLPRCLIAVNHEFAPDALSLKPQDEIAVIPPVSGGSL